MLYKIHHNHVGAKSFGENLLSLIEDGRTPPLNAVCHGSLFHEFCQSYHTLHNKKFINYVP